ncbi:hypothetical protein [Psychroserpens sp.]
MNLKKLHKADKSVQIELIKTVEEGKVISLQIEKDEILKEHISKVPAILICISGKAIYKEKSREIALKNGAYVFIEPNVKHQVIASKKSNFILVK